MSHDAGAVVSLCATVVAVYMAALWLASVFRGDPSFVDAAWGYGFVIVAWVARLATEGDALRSNLIVVILTVWGVRLGTYLLWRWLRTGPDPRYEAMIRKAGGNPHLFTLRTVFGLQGLLMVIVSLPAQLGQVYDRPSGITAQAVIGVVLAAIGIAFESIGDYQLVRFKADPANKGKVLDSGLWRYTRHPNYFGDALMWWGVFLVAVVNLPTFATIIGPIIMTVLLLKYSGVPLLERRLVRNRPDYADYANRTSLFIPRRPRR